MENWKSHKWEIFLIPEHTIKTYKNINNNKFRPVIVLSNARWLGYRFLIMECSSHKIDGHSILLYEYTDRFNNKKANYVLPNRLHTIESQHFKYENRLRNRVPEERRSEITKYFKVLIDIVDSDN